MQRKLILSSVALLALAACGDSEKAADTNMSTADSSPAVGNSTATVADTAAPPAGASSASGYAMRATMGDLFEIESSKLALERSKSPEVKQFAQMMVDGHGKTSAELIAAMSRAGVAMAAPTALDAEHAAMLAGLREASATDFDTRYLDAQTKAHDAALELHSGYASAGDTPSLKAFAATTAPVVQGHLDMVKKLDKSGADEPASNPPR